MRTRDELNRLAHARLRYAEVLIDGGRYDAARYLAGYAVELRLKARISATLRWPDFPHEDREFALVRFLKTHDLNVLLRLSGREVFIREQHGQL